eukprot:Polyplicarium_translucidae@DN1746_c0_g1_i1.p1
MPSRRAFASASKTRCVGTRSPQAQYGACSGGKLGFERVHQTSGLEPDGFRQGESLRVVARTPAQVLYLDADCVVAKNLEFLFVRRTPAFAPDVFPPDRFNAGVFVCTPSVAVFSEMQNGMSTMASHDGGDTGFLNSFFPTWFEWDADHRLPFNCNAQRTLLWSVGPSHDCVSQRRAC